MKAWNNGQLRELSAEEIAVIEAERKEWNDAEPSRKLNEIKKIRNRKLQETDFYALSDVTMSDAMSTYRQALRDIPQDYSEADYDDLLARDEQGNLTHTVWSKP